MTKTSLVNTGLTSKFTKKSLDQLHDDIFPTFENPFKTFGARVLVQVATPLKQSDGGIILTDDTLDLQKWTQNLAKVIELGPVAFKDRDTLKDWPEGAWCKPGEYIHAPLYGGHRTEFKNHKGQVVLLAMIQDRECYQGIRDGFDPMQLKPWFSQQGV